VTVLDLDRQALAAIYGGARGPYGPAMVAFTVLGSGWAALLLVPLIGWSRTRRFASALAVAIVVQAVWVWAVKLAVGRVRPWIALGLAPPLGAPHDGSFPSGHASGSFCVAAFLAVALPFVWRAPAWKVRLASLGALAVAALIALSRVYLGAHFPSDVLAGAVGGAGFGAVAGGLYLSHHAVPTSPCPTTSRRRHPDDAVRTVRHRPSSIPPTPRGHE
jgi:undecaprenyl-diphosphatase